MGLVRAGRLARKIDFTFEYGLRWEYFSPYSEKYNRLVNLDLTGSGSGLQITNVCGTASAGCAMVYNQFGTPPSLVNPDKSMYSPRIAIAWPPKFKWTKQTVVRSGYGINYNTGAYSSFASSMSFQQPFAITQTNHAEHSRQPHYLHYGEHVVEYAVNAQNQSTTASTAPPRLRRATSASIPTTVWAWCRSTTSASSVRCPRALCSTSITPGPTPSIRTCCARPTAMHTAF